MFRVRLKQYFRDMLLAFQLGLIDQGKLIFFLGSQWVQATHTANQDFSGAGSRARGYV